jgi:phosphoribosylcarboxyaminoimidazole (NCAIR) mutase
MDFATIAKAAMDLGVIPALALFLIVSMHRQNKRLTDMVEKREQNNLEMIKILVSEIVTVRKETGLGKL